MCSVDANDSDDVEVAELVRALRQSAGLSDDDFGRLLEPSAQNQRDEGAAHVSANRLHQISQALGVPPSTFGSGAKPAANAFAVPDLVATALSLRLLKAFNQIEDASVREGFVRLIERAVKVG